MNMRPAFSPNATAGILDAGMVNSGLSNIFEHVLSTDAIGSYEPDPRAYRIAMREFGLNKQAILFVACAGWDAAGAMSFGCTTYWVNQLGLPAEQLGVVPDGIAKDLNDRAAFVAT